jgi:hypothetical protein
MPYKIEKVNNGYVVSSTHRGLTKYYSKHPMTYENAKKQYLFLEKNYRYHGGADPATDTGNSTINKADNIIGYIPEANEVFNTVNSAANLLLEHLPNHLLPSAQFREMYGDTFEDYQNIIEKYGIDSDEAETFRNYYPGASTEGDYIYNNQSDPDSGLKYPLALQEAYQEIQNLGPSNYKANAAAIAKKYGLDWTSPSVMQMYNSLYRDHTYLGEK